MCYPRKLIGEGLEERRKVNEKARESISQIVSRKILRSALYLLYNPNAKSLKDKYF